MTDTQQDEALPVALIDDRRRVSLVWLIPLVAILAAAWLAYRSYEQQGPMVTISFQTADGLEAGKTKVRFKDVDVGLVEAIEISSDLRGVRVLARMQNHVAAYLNDKTRFWVVRPRFSGGEVSGLGTLVGGTYIGVDLTKDGAERREFSGLETPPIVTATQQGKNIVLRATRLGSLSVGSPVLYRGIEVGRVTGYALREPHGVDVKLFVHTPHDAKIGANTRFWNVSGMSLSLDATGVRLAADSLASVLLGGIAFGVPDRADRGAAVDDGATFDLFSDRETALERRFMRRETWQMLFSGSARGLLPGAPVELRGIRIGEVLDVQLRLSEQISEVQIPVAVAIEPERLGLVHAAPDEATRAQREREVWDGLVDGGLRAQLKTANLVTGALYVDLDFYPGAEPQRITWDEGPPRMPTVPTTLDELRTFLTRVAKLPVEQVAADLSASLNAMRDTMAATNTLLQRLDRETASELNKTLAQTRTTLTGLDKFLKPNSPLQAEAHRALQELGSAARSLRIMADYLERHPEALLRGKGDGLQ